MPTSRGLSQASTSFIGSWCQGIHHVPLVACHLLQRCSRPLCSSQDTGGPGHLVHADPESLGAVRGMDGPSRRSSLIPQDPTVRLTRRDHFEVPLRRTGCTDEASATSQIVDVPLVSVEPAMERSSMKPSSAPRLSLRMLLRKEVIQPHLPVRLPCYDFVPIASPTFDGSLHKGWATGFGCCRLS